MNLIIALFDYLSNIISMINIHILQMWLGMKERHLLAKIILNSHFTNIEMLEQFTVTVMCLHYTPHTKEDLK